MSIVNVSANRGFIETAESQNNDDSNIFPDIKKLMNVIKVMKGRYVFLKSKKLSEDIPLEERIGEILSYEKVFLLISQVLFKRYLLLNEACAISNKHLNVGYKKIKNSTCPLLISEQEKEIIDLSYEVSKQMKSKMMYIYQIKDYNRKMCSTETDTTNALITKLHESDDQLDSTFYQQRRKTYRKKQKKLQSIKISAELTWGILSLFEVDYDSNDKFKDIFFHVNHAKYLSLKHKP